MISKLTSLVSHAVAALRLRLVLRVAAGVMFVAVGLAAVLLTRAHMRDQALFEAESKARILLDRNLATHTYFSHQLKPRLFEWTDPFRDEDYFDPTWMSSTYAVREIDKYFQSLNPADYYYKESAVDARNPENEADAYEAWFLQELNENPDLAERSLVRTLDDQPYFVTLRRGEVLEESCLRCHSAPAAAPQGLLDQYGSDRSFGRQIDDIGAIVSAISIRVPLAEAFHDADRFAGQLSLVLLAILIALFGAQAWLYDTFLFAPVEALRGQALRIAVGDRRLGGQIPLPRGRELRELTLAFNQMSRSLRSSYDQLEQRVVERTADLAQSNEELEREIAQRKQVEQALRASEIRFRHLFNGMGNGVAVYRAIDGGRDFIIRDINPAGQRISQVSREDVVGKSVREAFPGVVALGLFDVLQDVYRTGTPRHQPLANYQDERISLWVDNYVYQLPSGEVVAVYDDVTERQRIARQLQASERRYHELVENQGEGIGVVDADETFVFANPAAHEIFGVAPGSLQGRSLRDFVDAEGYATIREQTRLRRAGREDSYEIDITRPDGQHRTLLVTATPHHDEAGAFDGTLAVFRDITDRRRLEDLLQMRVRLMDYAVSHSLQEVLQRTLDEIGALTNSPIGFYHFVDEDQQAVSLQAWSTRTLEEFCTAQGRDHYPIDEAGVWADCIRERRPVIHNDFASLPHRKGMPEGHAEVIRELVVPVFRAGTIVAILGVGNKPSDYTEIDVERVSYLADVAWEMAQRKRAEQQLETYAERLEDMVEERTQELQAAQARLLRNQKLALLGQLAGSINHELRGPLGNIKSAAYFLEMVLADPCEDVQEVLSLLQQEVERAESIITSLLNFVRTQEPERRPVDVSSLVGDVLDRTNVPQEITLAVELDEDLPTILADPNHLGQILRNLISNAVEAMPGEGRLGIRTAAFSSGESAAPQEVLISVSDTGRGISPDQREKIFEPLFSTKPEGVGLGLALAQMLVAAHGGTIELESEVGMGATFTVRLPLEGTDETAGD
ncbi:MAG: c-type heme family protein [Chloroflexota bacterium]